MIKLTVKTLQTLFLFAVVLTLFLAGRAIAAPSTMNTNDGLLDPNWPVSRYTSLADNPAIPNALEIKAAYIGSNADHIYFRIQTYSAPAAPTGYTGAAGIDCNNDSIINDASDRLIGYAPGGDYVWVADGTGAFIGSPGIQYGERVPAAPNNDNLEWQLYFGAGSGLPAGVFPPACQGAARVMFAISTYPGGVIQDQTGIYPWNIPTAIDLEDFSASSSGSSNDASPILIMGLVIVSGIWSCKFLVSRKR